MDFMLSDINSRRSAGAIPGRRPSAAEAEAIAEPRPSPPQLLDIGCSGLVRQSARQYIGCMNVQFELPPGPAEKLRQAAEQLGVSPSELARAAVTDLLAGRDDDFRRAAEHVLQKNAELYRRLA